MAGLVPAIHAVQLQTLGQPRTVASAKPRQIAFGCLSLAHGVDGRDKPGHDASML
jgi:hypothetical protein